VALVTVQVQGSDGNTQDVLLDTITGETYAIPIYKLSIGDVGLDGGPISAANPMPIILPAGASTEAKQNVSNASLGIMDDWDESDRAKVNPIAGQAGIAGGSGVDGASVPRVSLATDIPLPAGTNVLGTTREFKLEVARGNVSGVTIMSAMGEFESGNIDAAGEDVCRWEDVSGPARLPTPAAAGEQMTVVSSNNADNGATVTGILTARIHYLDNTGAEQTEDITLNGTTPVNTVATDMRFINDFYTLTVGSNGVAEGNISLYKQGGAIATDLYNLIAAGGNKSLVPHRMVPLAKKLYLQGWSAMEAQGKRAAFRIRSTDMFGILLSGVFCFKDVAYLNGNTSGELCLWQQVPALSIVKVSHWDDVVGAEGSCSWWGFLVDD